MTGDCGVTATERNAERREHEKLRRRFTPGDMLRCLRCGLTLHAATIEHEQALVFASVCPRCDGPLPMPRPTANRVTTN